jgi:DNA-binding CsgD family transcriptional regulator
MTIAAAGIEQLVGGKLSADSRPVAALAVTADDLPDLRWERDDEDSIRFAVVRLDGHEFALESYDDASEKQTTVYGAGAGDALDRLIETLGLDEKDVLDRVDQTAEADSSGAVGAAEAAAREAAADSAAVQDRLEARLDEIRARLAEEAEQRKFAVAVLQLGGDALTERERTVLALLGGGLTLDEAAQEMGVTRRTVLKYRRDAVRRYKEARGVDSYVADRAAIRKRILQMRGDGMTLQAIADQLNAEGVPPPRERGRWRPSSVQTTVGYSRRRPRSASGGRSKDS